MLLIPKKVNEESQRCLRIWRECNSCQKTSSWRSSAVLVTENCADLGDKLHLLPKERTRGFWRHPPGPWTNRNCFLEDGCPQAVFGGETVLKMQVLLTNVVSTAAVWQPLPRTRNVVTSSRSLRRPRLPHSPGLLGLQRHQAKQRE